LVREGIKVAIVGEPNAGKSTLLNALSGEDAAIVTDIPGTTRDILRQNINIDGLPLHIIDTAGLRESDDPVEQEGIRRAKKAMTDADVILLLVDATQSDELHCNQTWLNLRQEYGDRLILVLNKIDLTQSVKQVALFDDIPVIQISAKHQIGMPALREKLKAAAGFVPDGEGGFIARRRHLDALKRAHTHLDQASTVMQSSRAGELVAEELRMVQTALGDITGKLTSDELLGKIFSSFCIGK
jgi:tRNA modification GTPase